MANPVFITFLNAKHWPYSSWQCWHCNLPMWLRTIILARIRKMPVSIHTIYCYGYVKNSAHLATILQCYFPIQCRLKSFQKSIRMDVYWQKVFRLSFTLRHNKKSTTVLHVSQERTWIYIVRILIHSWTAKAKIQEIMGCQLMVYCTENKYSSSTNKNGDKKNRDRECNDTPWSLPWAYSTKVSIKLTSIKFKLVNQVITGMACPLYVSSLLYHKCCSYH